MDVIIDELLTADLPYRIILPLGPWKDMEIWCEQHYGRRGIEWEAQWAAIDYSISQGLFYFKHAQARNLFILRWC